VYHLWSHWLHWATACPEKRRALAQLAVSDTITPQSHQTASHAMAGVANLLGRIHERGPLREAPLEFVLTLMSALADATIDAMLQDPANADTYGTVGFAALWRILT
jgi:hypothetical protein